MADESTSAHLRRRMTSRLASVFAAVVLVTASFGGLATPAGAEASFTFSGGGWGHGVGLSQYGACGMAESGSSYVDILTHYYTGTLVSTVTEPTNLRVLLAESTTFTLAVPAGSVISGVGEVTSAHTVTVERSGPNAKLTGGISATVGLPLTVANSGAMKISPPSDRFDRGHLVIRPSTQHSDKLRAVVEGLSTRDYLLGLGEMSASWPAEALKAQATAARTVAVTKAASSAGADHDLKGYIDGAFIGYEVQDKADSHWSSWVNAIDSTAGKVVTHGGTAINSPVYSSSSGGRTENSENVWVATVPYLKGVADPTDSGCGNKRHSWTRTFTASELASLLTIPTVHSITTDGNVAPSGRTDKAAFTFTDVNGATHSFTGAQLRWKLGLYSTKFTVDGATTTTPESPVNRAPTGDIGLIRAHEGRNLLVAGRASDPDGTPRMFVADQVNGRTRWYVFDSAGGNFMAAFPAEAGKHTTCVAVLDTPSGAGTVLGCRNTVVK